MLKQVCIPVGCVPPACWPYLPACTVAGGLLARAVSLPRRAFPCWAVSLPRGIPAFNGTDPSPLVVQNS